MVFRKGFLEADKTEIGDRYHELVLFDIFVALHSPGLDNNFLDASLSRRIDLR